MSTQDRAVSPIDELILTQSYIRKRQAGEPIITTEQRKFQPCPVNEPSDVSSISPSTNTQTSIDDPRPNLQYRERVGAEEIAGTAEPGETHAFLPNKYPVSNSMEHEKTKVKNSSAILLTTWWIEIASLAIAIAALIAIVVTMAEYHRKEQPAWKYAINLNTLIAILSTLLRACMVVVVEEVMSQLKWMLFRQPKPVQHLAHFDTAARGPWGSLLLIFRTKTLNSALLGCIVVVLSVGIGPFTQQAVKAVPCELPLEPAEASIRTSRWMSGPGLARLYAPRWDLDMDTKVAILDGLANPNTTRSEISPGCSTGNCSFPSYNGVTHSAVGVCRRCVDITPWITETLELYHYPNGTRTNITEQNLILPDGSGIGGARSQALPTNIIRVSGHGTIWKDRLKFTRWNGSLLAAFDDSFEGIFRSSILNVSVITFTNNGCELVEKDRSWRWECSHHNFNTSYPFMNELDVVATACSLYPCIRDYHGSVRNTIFTETAVRDTPILQPPGQKNNTFPDFAHFHTPCLVDGQAYTIDNITSIPKEKHNLTRTYLDNLNGTFPTQCSYGVSGIYALSLIDFMQETLLGNCTAPSRINFNGDSDDYNSLSCNPWYIKGLVNKGNASFESIDANMQSVATAITSEMRKQGNDWYNNAVFVKGTVLRTTVCTQFDWIWLSFPLALIALTTLLLCIMCGKMLFDRQKIPAWKSSVLPLLFTGNQIGTTIVAGDMGKITADTKKIVARLSNNGRGWEFVSENHHEAEKKAAGLHTANTSD